MPTDRMSLREAAERTSRSVTTLRRYIRSGRLHAEKRYGRFGPEYFVADEDLSEAGLTTSGADSIVEEVNGNATRGASPPRAISRRETSAPLANTLESVPLGLFEDLQLKHEQLLVQYGMMRASGLRVMELQAERDETKRLLEDAQQENRRLRRDLEQTRGELEEQLRRAQLELEGRELEIAALNEKVRALEMLTRNAVTNETIDKQFEALMRQQDRVRRLSADMGGSAPSPGGPRSPSLPERDH